MGDKQRHGPARERERGNEKEETTQHKTAKEPFSHESTTVSTQATSVGKPPDRCGGGTGRAQTCGNSEEVYDSNQK